MKLTASAISDYLESPKKFYWRYVYRNGNSKFGGVEPSQRSQAAFDHDLLIGSCWAEFVDAFYRKGDCTAPRLKFLRESEGWLNERIRQQYNEAFIACQNSYYTQFSPDDGARNGSELRLENDRFLGYLDGLSPDGIIHECKMTSRAPSQEVQLWRIENSIQVKLYAVLAKAKGVRIEFAYKDAPNVVWRAQVREISSTQRYQWEQELNALWQVIEGHRHFHDPCNYDSYPCHPNGCTLVTKRFVGACPYRLLCDGDPAAQHFYKERDNDR